MTIRHWFRERLLGDDAEGNDVPPGASLVNTLLGREGEAPRASSLGEYDSQSYPAELAEVLRRRGEVLAEVLRLDLTRPEARVEAIPHLRALLRRYPHPLIYETLLRAYLDAERWDEAKGVAFAARERRQECARSEFPEIRAEIDSLQEWSSEDIDEIREERQRRREGG